MYNTYDVHFYASFALIDLWPKLQVGDCFWMEIVPYISRVCHCFLIFASFPSCLLITTSVTPLTTKIPSHVNLWPRATWDPPKLGIASLTILAIQLVRAS